MKAVIPAAGEGTRMQPATYAVAKEMLPVAGKPAIQHVVEECEQAGIQEAIVVIAPDKTEIIQHLTHPDFASEELAIRFETQTEPQGLGDAVLQDRRRIGDEDAFAVLYPDNLVRPAPNAPNAIEQLVAVHERTGGPVTQVIEIEGDRIQRYVSLDGESADDEDLHRANGFVEKPEPNEAPSQLAPIGRHILTTGILPILGDLDPGHGDAVQLTDARDELAQQRTYHAKELEGQRLDVGNHQGFLEANLKLGLENQLLDRATLEAALDQLTTTE